MKRYSIIVPVYKAEKYLATSIESVLSQTRESLFELILVDDGSPDNCPAICESFASRDDRIQVIHQQNQGVGVARNSGLIRAEGEYVLFLDSDDSWEPELLEEVDKLIVTYSKTEQPDVVAFSYTEFCEKGERFRAKLPLSPEEGESGIKWLERMFALPAMPFPVIWAYAYRREFLLQQELFFRTDLAVSEDFEFLLRVLPCASIVCGKNIALYNYRIDNAQSATKRFTEKKLLGELETKAEVFRRFPNAATANKYLASTLLVCRLPKAECREILNYISANRDILDYVSGVQHRGARMVYKVLGFYTGSKVILLAVCVKTRIRQMIKKFVEQ